jgi:hypothetical protein
MFILDSLLIGGIRWALDKALIAAEAELNDDSALRDRLLEAEMQREMGEITDEEFARLEADLLQAIRDVKARREGGSGAIAFGGSQPMEMGDGQVQIEAELSGDFYGEEVRALTTPGETEERPATPLPPAPTPTSRTPRTNRTNRTPRTTRPKRSK